jgi:hypothetical protein
MSKAEGWCNTHGLDDGQKWCSLLAALRREEDDPESEVCPCDWYVIRPNDDGGEERERFEGVAWPDNSGIFMMEGYWDVIAPDGTAPSLWPDGRAERGDA